MQLLWSLAALCFVHATIAELVFVQLVYRHGDRTPIETYPYDPYQASAWPNGFRQLTRLGCRQQTELGTYLRSRYANFLSPNYTATEVYIRSTDTDRTLNSAQCNNAGLFRPPSREYWHGELEWQPIPVHSIPTWQDYLLRTGFECPKLTLALQATEDQVERVNNAYQQLFYYLEPRTGFMPFQWRHVQMVTDTLKRIEINNYTLPDWSLERWTDVDSGEVMPIKDIIKDLNRRRRLWEMNTPEKAKFEGGLFIGTVVNDIDRKLNGSLKTPTKMFIYSAHDGVMIAYMSGLGIINDQVPPVASCLMVELHKEESEYVVRIYLRNSTTHEPYLMLPRDCNPDGCTLSQFREASHPTALYSLWQRHDECYNVVSEEATPEAL